MNRRLARRIAYRMAADLVFAGVDGSNVWSGTVAHYAKTPTDADAQLVAEEMRIIADRLDYFGRLVSRRFDDDIQSQS